ncbi:hypothetical protein [Cryptosporangium aurantiacum]|nr:hypothetical protein [Cryptosporangium aurantiacum]
MIDSGGFSELQRNGRWRWIENEYGSMPQLSEVGDRVATANR